MVQYHS